MTLHWEIPLCENVKHTGTSSKKTCRRNLIWHTGSVNAKELQSAVCVCVLRSPSCKGRTGSWLMTTALFLLYCFQGATGYRHPSEAERLWRQCHGSPHQHPWRWAATFDGQLSGWLAQPFLLVKSIFGWHLYIHHLTSSIITIPASGSPKKDRKG